jgi:hypothetical protein
VQDEKLGLIYQAKVQMVCGTKPDVPEPPDRATGPSEDRLRRGVDPKRTRDIAYLCAHISPGMATTTDIKTDQRRIITFLLSPIQRRLAEAGREE